MTAYSQEEFRKWILEQKNDLYEIKEDDHQIILDAGYAAASIVFHDMNIIELIIQNAADGLNRFYLHFQLNEKDHAQSLFKEMQDTLIGLEGHHTLNVMLSCSSALTTSFFAENLQQAADSMGLDYHFEAVSYNRLYEKGSEADVILLAPQIGFELEKVKEAFHHRVVMVIPAKIFAQYNAYEMIAEIRNQISERSSETKEHNIEITANDAVILVVAVINRRDGKRYGYRVYDHGENVMDGEVIKPNMTLQDLEDIITTCYVRYSNIDIVGLALPGTAAYGELDYPELGFHHINIEEYFAERFPMRFYLVNDTNAAVAGYHIDHQEDISTAFLYIPDNMLIPGVGIMQRKDIIKGKNGFAGEVGSYFRYLYPDESKLNNLPLKTVLTDTLMAIICVFAPDKVVINCRQYPFVEDLKAELEKYIDQAFMPEIEITWHMKHYMMPGMVIQCLDYLNHEKVKRRLREMHKPDKQNKR